MCRDKIMLDYPENIKHYLDSTFLKTSFELDVKDDELKQQITDFIIEAIDYQFKCVMTVSYTHLTLPTIYSV